MNRFLPLEFIVQWLADDTRWTVEGDGRGWFPGLWTSEGRGHSLFNSELQDVGFSILFTRLGPVWAARGERLPRPSCFTWAKLSCPLYNLHQAPWKLPHSVRRGRCWCQELVHPARHTLPPPSTHTHTGPWGQSVLRTLNPTACTCAPANSSPARCHQGLTEVVDSRWMLFLN